MNHKSISFNLRELAGSMGDFGTLFPLAIGYIAVVGLDPTGLFVMMGLANIVTGIVYKLPMPIEPMKVLAVVAIAHRWQPSMVYACGFSMGVVWLVFGFTNIVGWIKKYTPKSVIRGIQVALGLLLAIEAFKMLRTGWLLGIISIILVLVFRKSRYAPAAILLMLLGVGVMFFKGSLTGLSGFGFSLPPLTTFSPTLIWQSLLEAGFAQIPLTATNAVIATAVLIKSYWPDKAVSEKNLSLNMGIMNLIAPFMGGMPLCHGAGGLAGQYYFGARTGRANLIEGTIEILLGVFLAASLASILVAFPKAVLGAMLLLVGIELTKFAKGIRLNKDFIVMAVTVAVAVPSNMAFGFLAGLAVHYVMRFFQQRKQES